MEKGHTLYYVCLLVESLLKLFFMDFSLRQIAPLHDESQILTLTYNKNQILAHKYRQANVVKSWHEPHHEKTYLFVICEQQRHRSAWSSA